jgi:hypothetical protein
MSEPTTKIHVKLSLKNNQKLCLENTSNQEECTTEELPSQYNKTVKVFDSILHEHLVDITMSKFSAASPYEWLVRVVSEGIYNNYSGKIIFNEDGSLQPVKSSHLIGQKTFKWDNSLTSAIIFNWSSTECDMLLQGEVCVQVDVVG